MEIGNACAKILKLKGSGMDWDGECYNCFKEFTDEDKKIHQNRRYIRTGVGDYGKMSGWNSDDHTFSDEDREFKYGEWKGDPKNPISRISGMMQLFTENLDEVWNECSHKKNK